MNLFITVAPSAGLRVQCPGATARSKRYNGLSPIQFVSTDHHIKRLRLIEPAIRG